MEDFMRVQLNESYAAIARLSSYPSIVQHHRGFRFCAGVLIALTCFAASMATAQTTTYALGSAALLVGPAAGSNSVVLAVTPTNGAWTATANATWLHLNSANQSGVGNTNVIFSYDANPGATRSNTLTIGGQTLTVTQAGATYVAAGMVTTLASSGLGMPAGVAVDRAGNVYFTGFSNNVISEWTLTNNSVTTLVTNGLSKPLGLALDGAGNLYIADWGDSTIKVWTAANGSLATLVPSSAFYQGHPIGVGVDGAGNIYFSDNAPLLPPFLPPYNVPSGFIEKWTASNSQVIILVSNVSVNVGFLMANMEPLGVAVDAAGNVYASDQELFMIEEFTPGKSHATKLLDSLNSSGLGMSQGLAVDGSGNIYIADSGNSTIQEISAANGSLSTLVSSGLAFPYGVTVDASGNVYIADSYNDAVKELPHAFVDPTSKLEGMAAGHDVLQAVLPSTANLLPPLAPTSDQSWLTITGITNGVVSFSFTANTGPARTAHITLLGQTVSITQGVIGSPPTLTGPQMLSNGVLQFAFTNRQSASFTVLSSTNPSLPLSNWTVVGVASNIGASQFLFSLQPSTNAPQSFYTVRSP